MLPKKQHRNEVRSNTSPLAPESDPSYGLITQQTLESPKVRADLLRSLKMLMHSGRSGRHFGLLCVRVDAKDAVNSLLGPGGVDQLLREACNRLRECIRTTDLLAAGEDGVFFVLATDLQSEDELELISDRIQRTCRQPYWIGGQEIRSGMTAGGVGGLEGAIDPTALAEQAVLAMLHAGTQGVPFRFFIQSTSKPSPEAEVPAFSSAKIALDEPLELCFQPQFTANLVLSGATVALRMRAPASSKRSKRASQRALPRSGNERIGDKVLREILLQIGAWREMGYAPPPLSFEIAANHLLSPSFADEFLKLLHETDTPASAIELLITEAAALTSIGSAQQTLSRLDSAGVQFGLSGFSLNTGTRLDFHSLPFSSLRVNCTSLFKVTSPGESRWLARSIVGVAHRCGLIFVAEDVDSADKKDILLESGCDRFEGSLFSGALTTGEMEALLSK